MGQTGGSHEEQGLMIKLLIYMAGVMIGLGAKLATINRNGKLTTKEIIFQTMIAFACSFIVWASLYYSGRPDMAVISSVIVGRFGDSLIIAIGKGLVQWVTKTTDDSIK